MIAYALLALLAPAGAALLLAAVPPLRRRGTPAAVITILASLVATASAAALLLDGTRLTAIVPWLRIDGHGVGTLGVHVDGISVVMLLVVTVVALCVQIFSVGYMHGETRPSYGRYFAYHALFLFSMNVLVLAPDLLQLFAGWELVGTTSYLLIGFYFQKPSAARAAVKAFWVTKLADMGFVLALAVLYAETGAFAWSATLAPGVAVAVTALLFLAVVGKSAQFPLHVWLPDAMEGPTPVSALLHAATMVAAGVFLIVRADPLFAQAAATRDVMLLVGAGTALFAAGLAVVQTDIKRVLAYSTCSQLGFMIAALGAGSAFGGFFHLTTHAFFKALLFLAAGSVIHALGSNDLADMGGLRRRMPWTTLAFAVGALSLAGLPGLAGFFSKDMVLASVEGRLAWVPYALLLATTFLTAFYMGRVLFGAFFGAPRGKSATAHEPGASMLLPLAILALPAVAAGWIAGPLATLAGSAERFHAGGTALAATTLGLAGLGLAWVARAGTSLTAPLQRLARTRAIDRLYARLYRGALLGGAATLAWIDRYLIDGVMNALGASILAGGRALRRLQTGRAGDGVFAVVVGALVLAAWGLLP